SLPNASPPSAPESNLKSLSIVGSLHASVPRHRKTSVRLTWGSLADQRTEGALRCRRRKSAQPLPEVRLIRAADVRELEAERAAHIARAAPVNDARDRGHPVDPAVRSRRPEREDDLFAGEDALAGLDQHPVGRQIEGKRADRLEVVLA